MDATCARALEVDVVNVTKIASMLEKATENTPPPPRPAWPPQPGSPATRPNTARAGTQLALIPRGQEVPR